MKNVKQKMQEVICCAIDAEELAEAIMKIVKDVKGDNSWLSMMTEAFLLSTLPALVLMRDLKIVINPAELASVSTFKDLEAKEKFEFNITSLLKYLNFQAAIDLYYMMNRLYKDDEFIRAIKTHDSYSALKEDRVSDVITGRLGRNLVIHGIDVVNETNINYAKLPPDIKKNHPKATEDLIKILKEIEVSQKG